MKLKYIWLYVLIAAALIIGAWYVLRRDVSAPTQTPVAQADYLCREGKYMSAKFFEGQSQPPAQPGMPPTPGGSVELKLSDGRDLNLHQTISADGARYANPDESFVFWSKGNGALVLENNQQKSYIGCVIVSPGQTGFNSAFLDDNLGFTIVLPQLTSSSTPNLGAYTLDENYKYQLAPGKDIYGVKFTIPQNMATGTNLAQDTYISVESIPNTPDCSASLFLYDKPAASQIDQYGTAYSVASTTGAGAGNRYEETVYALSSTNPCVAVRYFIHYGVIQNYPAGSVKQFDETALKNQFDQIRSTLRLAQ